MHVLDNAAIAELSEVLGADFDEFLGTFVSCSNDLLTQMLDAAERLDRERLIMTVHSFKGSARNLGATHLASLLAELEEQLREIGLQNIDPSFANVQDAYQQVCTALDSVRASHSAHK